MTTVVSPGSSANLGPGFDVLGLAISRHVWAGDEATCAGRGGAPCAPGHVARIAYETAGGERPLWFGFDLIPGRGLGFSAAARAAGAVLARVQAGDDLTTARAYAYALVADLEGHGDNAAPSLFGGLFLIAGGLAHPIDVELPGSLLCWVPETVTATDESRAALSTTVDRQDAIFNLGRMGLLLSALYEQRPELLREATQDRLHQAVRFAAQPESAAALAAGLDAGALCGWLSGSGPTVALLCERDKRAEIAAILPAGATSLALDVDLAGSILVEPSHPPSRG